IGIEHGEWLIGPRAKPLRHKREDFETGCDHLLRDVGIVRNDVQIAARDGGLISRRNKETDGMEAEFKRWECGRGDAWSKGRRLVGIFRVRLKTLLVTAEEDELLWFAEILHSEAKIDLCFCSTKAV